jgi:hypothetical protein
LLFVGHGASAFLADTRDEQHVGRLAVELEQSATSSRKTEGAHGRKLSQYLTCIQPTAFPALNDFAVRSITSWSEKVVNLGRRSR